MNLDARLAQLPIFPLPAVQLFPHAVLPLHVFEPRYRALLADVMAADRVFAVAMLDPSAGSSPRGLPAVLPVCGVGAVIAHEPLDDGRSNILVRGLTRARIVDELPQTRLYRVVRATALADHYQAGVDLAPSHRALLAVVERLAAALPTGGDTLRELVRAQADPGALADVLAATTVSDPAARQALLENLDVADRIDRLTTGLAAALGRYDEARGRAN